MTNLVLLGPQRHHPRLREATENLGLKPPWAVISAGWQEREAEIEELEAHLGAPIHNLNLYQRAEAIFTGDPLLREAIRQHQQELIALQEVYRVRLRYAMGAVQQLLQRKKPSPKLLEPEIEDSFAAVRQLDSHHLGRIRAQQEAFNATWQLENRDSIAEHRQQIASILEGCSCVFITGGHVAILLNRMRLLGLPKMIEHMPCIAWAAGAMILGERIVLFHDSPPQGRGYAEVFERGLGRYTQRLVFPNAKKRLLLNDPIRVTMLARRFSSDSCWTLDDHAHLIRKDDQWQANEASHRLFPNGEHRSEVAP